MQNLINYFLNVRNSNFFNTLVIFVIIASAVYAGVSSYNIPSEYVFILEIADYSITIFFVIELAIRLVSEKKITEGCSGLGR